MDFKQLPIIYKTLIASGLEPVKIVSKSYPLCRDTEGNQYFMKDCRGTEDKIFTKVFPEIKKMNLDFKVLVLPEKLEIANKDVMPKASNQFIFIKYYDGNKFNKIWDEKTPVGYGGRGIDLGFSEKVIDLMKDFSSIDTKKLKKFKLPTFDFIKWKSHNLKYISKKLVSEKIITKDQVKRMTDILNQPDIFIKSRMILTNGDFYPRNFIELKKGRIVVLDWEGREDYKIKINNKKISGQRNTLINYTENHVAFFFVHMWGNDRIQKEFLKNASAEFKLSTKNLQAALIIKSLEQSLLFLRGSQYLAVRQAEIFVNALDKQYVKDLISSK